MKAKFNFSLLAISICLIVFSSCSSDDDPNNLEGIFDIENATYVNDDLPTGSDDPLDDLSINGNVINGGSSIISFSSAKELKTAHVGLQNTKGYYSYELTERQGTRANGIYYYQLVINIDQNVKLDKIILVISFTTKDGSVSKSYKSDEIKIIEAGTGDLQISLSWDQLDDVDLHVIDPQGNHVYYANSYIFTGDLSEAKEDEITFKYYIQWIKANSSFDVSGLSPTSENDWDTLFEYIREIQRTTGKEPKQSELLAFIEKETGHIFKAYLDIDSNAGCDIDEINIENIFFKDPTPGVYTIAVDLYDKCKTNTAGARYTVALHYKGQQNIKFSDNQTGKFADNDFGSGNDPERYVTIGKFTVPGNTRAAGVANERNNQSKRLKQRLFSK